MRFGTSECAGPAECGNTPHITGRSYVDEYGLKKSATEQRGIGISEIMEDSE